MSKAIEDIIDGARLGDKDDIGLLVDYLEADLLRFILLLARDPILAQDLCQDTFIRVIERIHQVKDPRKFKSWVYKIAKNIFYDYLKKASVRHEINSDDLSEVISLSILDNEEALINISNILNDLSHDDQLVILLSDLEKHEISEIAEIMEKSESAVKSHLHRAREHFMSKFSDNRINPDPDVVCINEALKGK